MIETSSQIASARLGLLTKLEALGQTYLIDKTPFVLPERHADTFVRGLPWMSMLFLPVQLAAVAVVLGASALATLVGHPSWVSACVSLTTFGLQVAALPGLLRRSRSGWSLFTLAMLALGVHELLTLSLFGAAIGAVCLWLMFQVRDRYVG